MQQSEVPEVVQWHFQLHFSVGVKSFQTYFFSGFASLYFWYSMFFFPVSVSYNDINHFIPDNQFESGQNWQCLRASMRNTSLSNYISSCSLTLNGSWCFIPYYTALGHKKIRLRFMWCVHFSRLVVIFPLLDFAITVTWYLFTVRNFSLTLWLFSR